jgi:DNA-directed RNA polymerase subunit beta'
MAVHVPLTQAAQIECWTLMLSSRNLLNPANGKPIVFPSQDMVLGINYMTRLREGAKGSGRRPSSFDEIMYAIQAGSIDYQAPILMRIGKERALIEEKPGKMVANEGQLFTTTAGRMILNEALPAEIGYINYAMGDKQLRALISRVYSGNGSHTCVRMLDTVKAMGFRYATIFGATIGVEDIIVPDEKKDMMSKAGADVDSIQKQYMQGHITSEERYNRVVEVWSKTNEDLTNVMMKRLEEDRAGFNPMYMMASSGARGSRSQIRQLAGMRGLMAKPSGDIIELPIRSNFKEGLSVIEFFISTNGARKGLADTALKTADAGYLTRRLVDIAQDVVVNEDDCGTINGIEYSALKDGEEVIETLTERIVGRFTIEPIKHPISGETIVDVNEEVTEEKAKLIEEAGIEKVRIRTVLTCESKHGVCVKCYGRNLANNRPVTIGEAVGIIAAQSIGQPGTQLTMRTFHIGGAATKTTEENRTYLRYPVIVKNVPEQITVVRDGNRVFTRKGHLTVARVLETIDLKNVSELKVQDGSRILKGQFILKKDGKEIHAAENAYAIIRQKENSLLLVGQDQRVEIRNGADLHVVVGQVVPADDSLATFDPFSEPILAEVSGTVAFEDIDLKTTLKEEVNEDTGNIEKKIMESSQDNLQPRIIIQDVEGHELATYYLPGGAYLSVDEGDEVKAGHPLAKILKESVKTRDITGGLPRVGELFEARRPKSAAVLALVSGRVHFKGIVKSKRQIEIEDAFGGVHKHLVSMSRHLLVRDGDTVEAGEPLCDGARDPHDVLQIAGENALQQFLVNEVQEVYRLQGVDINDKHIGVIIRQMMRKVEIIQVGDTNFIFGQQVDKYKFMEENNRVMKEGGQAAIARPMLLGITRASLNIDSFISAASFQETTRVLTNAAIAGSTDGLRGLKENVIIGHLIPAGTGMRAYRNLKLFDDQREDLDAHVQQILELRQQERKAEPAMQIDDNDYEDYDDGDD